MGDAARRSGTELEAIYPQEIGPGPEGRGLRWTGSSWLKERHDYLLPAAPPRARFQGPGHTWINQFFADDLVNKRHPHAYLWAMDRVEAGLKPLATFDLRDAPPEARARFQDLRRRGRHTTLLSPSGNLGCLTTLRPDLPLGRAFDLGPLAEDYEGLVARDRVLAVGELRLEGALALANRTNDLDPEYFWLRGLLFGYPVEVTLSILRDPWQTMRE